MGEDRPFTTSELELLLEALDSYEYWQLSDASERHSGYVILPGDEDEQEHDCDAAGCDAEEHARHDEIRATRALGLKMERMLKQATTPTSPDQPT
jgi:hypothetical protein